MAEKGSSSSSSGIGFLGLLTILFVGLKLTGYIDWSWFWVFSPVIFGWSFILLVLLIVLIIVAAAGTTKRKFPPR